MANYQRVIGPLPRIGYYIRRNEPKYCGHLVGGVYRDGYEVQLWTWDPHTAFDAEWIPPATHTA
jgi:hypothetical protein